MNDRISVCIPTCNRPEHVEQALQSVLRQEPEPFEIVVGDDSSNKETTRLMRRYMEDGASIEYLWNEPSLGQSKNVARLFREAQGDFIVLLHDDDRLLDGALDTLLSCFQNHLDVVAAYGKQQLISDAGAVKWEETKDLNENYFRTEKYAGAQPSNLRSAILQQFPNDAYMVRAETAKQVGYEYPNAGNAVDFAFGIKLARSTDGDFYLTNSFTSQYRRSEDSVARGGEKPTDSSYRAFKIVLTDLRDEVLEDPHVRQWLRMSSPPAIMQAAQHGHTKDGLRWFFSTYHRDQILTLGGLRRLLYLFYFHFLS